MRYMAFVASLICSLILPDMVFAMPVAPGLLSQRPPTHRSCRHMADAVPADIAGRMAAAGGTNSIGDPSIPTDGFPASPVAAFHERLRASGTHRDQLRPVSLFAMARRFESGFGPGPPP
jgi:hypothetical protein